MGLDLLDRIPEQVACAFRPDQDGRGCCEGYESVQVSLLAVIVLVREMLPAAMGIITEIRAQGMDSMGDEGALPGRP